MSIGLDLEKFTSEQAKIELDSIADVDDVVVGDEFTVVECEVEWW